MLCGIRSQVSGTKLYSELRRKPDRGASGIHEPPSGGPHIGGAPATPIAALSGSQHKAPGFAGGYLRAPSMIDSLEVEVLYPA